MSNQKMREALQAAYEAHKDDFEQPWLSLAAEALAIPADEHAAAPVVPEGVELTDAEKWKLWDAAPQGNMRVLHYGDAIIAADRAARAEPVAWVEVIDQHEGPYNFHGLELLPRGKHHLYTAPPAAPVVPEGWKLEILDDDRGVGVRVTRPDGSRHCFWRDGWKGEKNPSEQAAYDLCRAMLAAPAASQGNKAVAEAAVSEDRASRGGPIGKLRVREGLNGKSAHFGELEVSTLPDGVYPLYIIPPAVTEPLTSGVYTEQSLSIPDMIEAALKASRVDLVPGTTNWAYFMIQYLSKTKEAYSDK